MHYSDPSFFLKKVNDTDPLVVYFKSKGLTVDWDFNKRDGSQWYELFWNDKMYLQVGKEATVEGFIEWLNADPSFTAKFFLASGLPDKEFNEFLKLFKSDIKCV